MDDKRLILHFDILSAVLTFPDESSTPEAQINRWLAQQRVGSVDKDGNFFIDEKDPKISFIDFLAQYQQNLDDRQRRDMIRNFTEAKYPGEALRGQFETLAKHLSLPSLVKKAFGIEKTPRTGGAGGPVDASQFQSNLNSPRSVVNGNNSADFGYLLKSGYMNLFPGFVGLLNSLSREKRRATLVFHGPVLELKILVDELTALCEGSHPCYSGSNKTKKVLLDGTKGTIDFRPKEKLMGTRTAEGAWSFGERKYSDVQEWHAALLYELSAEGNTISVCGNSIEGSYYKDSKVHQIFFGRNPDITDPITLTKIEPSRLKGRAFVPVDPIIAAGDMEFFTKALASCETDYSISHKIQTPNKISLTSASGTSDQLSPRTYLNKKLFPALLPVLEMACRDRPADVNAYIGAHLLKYQKNASFRPPMNGN